MDDNLISFLEEAMEVLSQVDQDMVILERNNGQGQVLSQDGMEVLQRVFRGMHNFKGTAGMLGLARLERTSHAAEDVLGKVRDGSLIINSDVISVILEAIDEIKWIIGEIHNTGGAEPAGENKAVIEKLSAISNPQTLVNKQSPSPQQVHEPADGAASGAGAASGGGTAAAEHLSAMKDQSIRVNLEVLDGLMNLVGELVLTRNQLIQLIQNQDESEYVSPIQQLNRVTSGLQELVMKTRMQPIGNAWAKLPRLVRDVAKIAGKQAELVMTGHETEVDRQILQVLQDPLVHCVRNSVDHGLEKPEKRLGIGKPAEGTIKLNAFHEGGYIIVEISDDGGGVNLEAVRRKALERALKSKEELELMPETAVLNLIFEPGFSTAEKVTELSGRGVGMDVVRSNIEKIGGSVDLSSNVGRGTVIRMKIPLTLAIIPAMIVGVGTSFGQEIFAVPQASILELVRIGESTKQLIEEIRHVKLLRLRNELLPLIDLADDLGLGKVEKMAQGSRRLGRTQDRVIVVAEIEKAKFGIFVDEIFDTQEIVVKPVGRLVREINFYAGTTILGDGRVVMILDIARIVARSLPRLVSEQARKEALEKATQGSGASLSHGKNTVSGEKTSFLLFRVQNNAPMAIPLALVSRLEEFPSSKIEHVDGQYFIQYRHALLPLVPCGKFSMEGESLKAIIFSDTKRAMGLVVSEILDIVEETLVIENTGKHAGVLGTAIISGVATEVVDTYHYLKIAYKDWFERNNTATKGSGIKKKVLFAEDSSFFQDLIKSALISAGYDVTMAENGAEALAKCSEEINFDIVLSDIEMPVMNGLNFVKKLREKAAWKNIPVIAMTSLQSELDRKVGLAAGFSEYLVKFDQDKLLKTLESLEVSS